MLREQFGGLRHGWFVLPPNSAVMGRQVNVIQCIRIWDVPEHYYFRGLLLSTNYSISNVFRTSIRPWCFCYQLATYYSTRFTKLAWRCIRPEPFVGRPHSPNDYYYIQRTNSNPAFDTRRVSSYA